MMRCAAFGLMLLCAGCAGRAEVTAPAETVVIIDDDSDGSITVEPPVLVSIVPEDTVEVLPIDCTDPREETCNGLDDDCDGEIDNECGYRGGLMQVTSSWDTGSDIDLYVQGPLGDTLSFQRRSTPTGGRVDHLGRGDCTPDLPNPRQQNIRWVGQRPPEGVYEVEVHYWGDCISGGGPTTVTVSVAVARKVAGQFRLTILAGERLRVARFVIQ